MMAILLQGMLRLTRIKSLIYRRNEFGELTAVLFSDVMKRYMPYNLEELRIERCDVSKVGLQILLEQLANQNYLRRLALVKVQIDEFAALRIVDFVTHSRYLFELDLSYNHVKPMHMQTILEGIAHKSFFQVLNLSNNFFIDQASDGQSGFSNQFKILKAYPTDRELEPNELVNPDRIHSEM